MDSEAIGRQYVGLVTEMEVVLRALLLSLQRGDGTLQAEQGRIVWAGRIRDILAQADVLHARVAAQTGAPL